MKVEGSNVALAKPLGSIEGLLSYVSTPSLELKKHLKMRLWGNDPSQVHRSAYKQHGGQNTPFEHS